MSLAPRIPDRANAGMHMPTPATKQHRRLNQCDVLILKAHRREPWAALRPSAAQFGNPAA
jgi:hypothetical protein